MIRTTIAGQILSVSEPVTIGEGDKAVLKQTIIVKQNAEQDEWSGRDFPSDTWEIDIIGKDEITRHGLDQTYANSNIPTWGTFYVQINSRPVAKKNTDPKKPVEIMYPVNIRLGRIDFKKA